MTPRSRAEDAPRSTAVAIPKTVTHIPGLDHITNGGLPTGRTTLIAGTAGSGKTVLACQFLVVGIEQAGEPGVFVTFEDSPKDIRQNVRAFGWDLEAMERAGQLAFVDATPNAAEPTESVGAFDLGALLARIEHAVKAIGAKRITLDSLNALFPLFPDHTQLRTELFQLSAMLKRLGLTQLLTAERIEDYGETTRYGIEEFVADNVIVLRNILADERRRRTIEVLKMRGSDHERGEVPFTINEGGIVVIPLTALHLTQSSSTVRITSGLKTLDRMCDGGFFRDSIVLVSGATGAGKTLLTTQFLAGGMAQKERCLFFAFEESRDQLMRNAEAWGMSFQEMERKGLLKIVTAYPHAMPMEDHYVRMRDLIDEFKPDRVAVDSLSALERVFTLRSFREFVIALTSLLKAKNTAGLFTSTTASLLGGTSVTERHISTLTDSIILLRYVELGADIRRGITVLKMRGSKHDHEIREFTIDGHGMRIGEPFRDVHGILGGNATEAR